MRLETGIYNYGGKVDGDIQRRVIIECAQVAKMFRLPPCDFDDVVHDALIVCMNNQRFDSSRGVQLWTYMRRVARNAALRSCKKRMRSVTCQAPDEQPVEGHEDGLQELSHDMQAVADAVDRLPVEQLRVIKLRFGLTSDGRHTARETAKVLAMSERKVYMLQRAAMETLGEVLRNG